jgi:hypothetical protein
LTQEKPLKLGSSAPVVGQKYVAFSYVPSRGRGFAGVLTSLSGHLALPDHSLIARRFTEGACSAHVRLPGEFAEAPLGMSPIHIKRTGKSSARQQIDFEFLSVSEAALVVLFVQKS